MLVKELISKLMIMPENAEVIIQDIEDNRYSPGQVYTEYEYIFGSDYKPSKEYVMVVRLD